MSICFILMFNDIYKTWCFEKEIMIGAYTIQAGLTKTDFAEQSH